LGDKGSQCGLGVSPSGATGVDKGDKEDKEDKEDRILGSYFQFSTESRIV